MHRANSDDCASNRMSRTDRNSGQGSAKERQSPGAFCAEPAKRLQLSNLRTHSVNDAPPAGISSGSDSGVGGENDEPFVMAPFVMNVIVAHIACSIQSTGYNP